MRWLLGFAGVVLVIYIAVRALPSNLTTPPVPTATTRPPTPRPTPTPIAVGQEVHLWSPDGEWYLARSLVEQGEYTQALAAKDTIGIQQLIRQGLIFPVEHGTRLLVLELYRDLIRVRVLEGAQYGKAGWLAFEHVR